MAHIRLLERKPNGDIVFRETTSGNVPAYAILSHLWGEGEVLYQDLGPSADMNNTTRKAGWKKIRFCAEQAAADGLRYFWVDTCCIDKTSSAELSASINSMFRWYQNAARCYAYLSDVPKPGTSADDERAVLEDFKTSRWFKRGWTLQEILAPKLVQFFTLDGKHLGDKVLLETEVHQITGIPRGALRGDALSHFTVKERMAWAERRETTLEEDQAYCMIGICEVSMPVIYAEGKDRAFRRLEEEIHKSDKGLDFEQYAVELNLLSLPEAAQFVAREKELSNMHDRLHGHNTRACVVLHGLGGMGKTQLARQYIKRYKEKYTSVFWLNANDHESLALSFRDIAQQILESHPATSLLVGIDFEDLDRVEREVKAWFNLKENGKWLLIFDNYDNPRVAGNENKRTVDIRKYLPSHDQGSIIITTRSAQVNQGHRIKVEKLPDIRQGLKILSNTSGRADIEHGTLPDTEYVREVANRTDSGARALVEELDGLPLALATAGAYLENVAISFSDYLRVYKASWLQLQRTSPQLESYEDRSLYTTWQITLDRIEEQNPSSARLLKLWAYFDREDIWFELLRRANEADDEWVQRLAVDELAFNEAVALLCSFGLVDPNSSLQHHSGSRGYSVHSCVHEWTKSVVNNKWDDNLALIACICVASEIPNRDEKEWWLLQQRLLPHAARLVALVLDETLDVAGHEWTLCEFGTLYSNQDKLAEAEQMYNRAVQDCEKALGPKHTLTLDVIHNLGRLYSNQGKLAEAEQMYTRALQGCEEVLGPKDISTLQTVNNLGMLYKAQGKPAEAGLMLSRALQGFEEVLGPKNTAICYTMNNLGVLYWEQGKLAEAEQMYTRALQGKEEVYGPKHTTTLDTAHNLGILFTSQGKLVDAEQMYTRALQGYEEVLGPSLVASYIPALNNMCALGNLFYQTGRKDLAIDMYSRALSGYQKAQGTSAKCSAVEDILRRLRTETSKGSSATSRTAAQKERSLKQKFRGLGERLSIRRK